MAIHQSVAETVVLVAAILTAAAPVVLVAYWVAREFFRRSVRLFARLPDGKPTTITVDPDDPASVDQFLSTLRALDQERAAASRV